MVWNKRRVAASGLALAVALVFLSLPTKTLYGRGIKTDTVPVRLTRTGESIDTIKLGFANTVTFACGPSESDDTYRGPVYVRLTSGRLLIGWKLQIKTSPSSNRALAELN
jgi:hypothetical protein